MPGPRLPHAVRSAAIAAAAVVISLAAIVPVRADTHSQLSSAQAKLNSLIRKVKVAQRAENAVQAQLTALAAQISEVQTKMAETQARIQQTSNQIAAAQAAINRRQGELDARAAETYEAGPASELELLLGSTSIADLTDRIELADAAARSDQDLIDALHDQQNVLRQRQTQLRQLQATLRAQQAQLEQQQSALNVKLAAAKKVFDRLAGAKRQAERLVSTLKRRAAAEARAALGRAVFFGGGGPSISGVLLTCPVRGPHGYVDDFGAPRPGHIHAGVDMQAGEGTPIVAPFPGNAVRTWDPGGGNGVMVYGALGYAYNAHLSSYGTLGSVSTGTVIGYVGATGDATGPHDHFEWHPNTIPAHPYVSPYGYSVVGTAIDPFPYLNSVC